MDKPHFIAEGSQVFMVRGDRRELFCTVSGSLLTPKIAAEDTAKALNDFMAR